MKLEVGMYVRTKQGYICKILKLNEPECDDGYLDFNDINSPRIQEKYIVNASHNIIDLIEVGDVITFKGDKDIYRVNCIPNKENACEVFWLEFKFDGIEDISISRKCMSNELEYIITKEQFEQISYKVGDDE